MAEKSIIDSYRFSCTEDLVIDARRVPWDETVFAFPVVAIERFEIKNHAKALDSFRKFIMWRTDIGAQIVSSRLPSSSINESIFLERMGFNYIETVLHPIDRGVQRWRSADAVYMVSEAGDADRHTMAEMARHAFSFERYHTDPRIPPNAANARYCNWVTNCTIGGNQRLLKITDNSEIIGFFIIEYQSQTSVYWHLTGIDSKLKGKGVGYNVWSSVLQHHAKNGIEVVSTTISSRNVPVLNLYAKLNFRFLSPDMTFHWIASSEAFDRKFHQKLGAPDDSLQ